MAAAKLRFRTLGILVLLVCACALLVTDPMTAVRIGEAALPGPQSLQHEPPDDFVDAIASDYDDWQEDDSQHEGPGLAFSSDEERDPPLYAESDDDETRSEAASSDTTEASNIAYIDTMQDKVIPPWDARLPPEQISAWRAAEEALGIKRSVKGWLAAKQKQRMAAC